MSIVSNTVGILIQAKNAGIISAGLMKISQIRQCRSHKIDPKFVPFLITDKKLFDVKVLAIVRQS